MRFDDFLNELVQRQKLEVRSSDLIGHWSATEEQRVSDRLTNAFRRRILHDAPLKKVENWRSKTPQARGNTIADHVRDCLLREPGIELVKGLHGGYPDALLRIDGATYPVEWKATSNYDPHGNLRIVLLSSPRRLVDAVKKGLVDLPARHILITAIFDGKYAAGPIITSGMLHFLRPDLNISLRYEASTSAAALAATTTHTITGDS